MIGVIILIILTAVLIIICSLTKVASQADSRMEEIQRSTAKREVDGLSGN